MEKMLRIPLAMMVSVLSVFLVAGTAGAVSCTVGSGNGLTPATAWDIECGCEADTAGFYALTGDLTCTNCYGIIIGASGVTIDGADHSLIGGGAASYNCDAGAGDSPCRFPVCSGIINANPNTSPQLFSCNPSAPLGQGGCDNVVVKNLKITGWCDGIFMSGDCNISGGPRSGAGIAGPEYRLTQLLIEGNCIQDNGDASHYNDGIFLGEVGVNCVNDPCSGNTPPPNVKAPCEDPCTSIEKGDADPMRNIVRHNRIYSQEGTCAEGCPGGNCINLCGGIEEVEGGTCNGGCWYSGGNEIKMNVCKKSTGCSCVQFHFGSNWNRIHGNYCLGSACAGIASACDWLGEEYIYNNFIKDCGGPGIGVNCFADIWNNYSLDNRDVDWCGGFGQAIGGQGILCADRGGENVNCCAIDNTCVGNHTLDINLAPGSTYDSNMCKTGSPSNVCEHKAGDKLNCNGDLDHDCEVGLNDFYELAADWGPGCCPCW